MPTKLAKDLQWGDRLALSNYKPEFARAYRFPETRQVKKIVAKTNPNGRPVIWVHMDDGHPQVYLPDQQLTLEGKTMNEGPQRPGFEQRAEQFRALVEKKKAETMKKEYPTLKPPKYTFDKGSKYWRMVETDDGGHGRRVFCFLNAENGDVLKAAGWKAPVTKNPRGNIFDADLGIGGVGQYGAKYIRGGPSYPFAGEGMKLSTIARELMSEAELLDPFRYHHWKIQQVTPTVWRVIDTKKGTTKVYSNFADVKNALGIDPNDLPFSVDEQDDKISPEQERQERDKEDYLRQQQSGEKDESVSTRNQSDRLWEKYFAAQERYATAKNLQTEQSAKRAMSFWHRRAVRAEAKFLREARKRRLREVGMKIDAQEASRTKLYDTLLAYEGKLDEIASKLMKELHGLSEADGSGFAQFKEVIRPIREAQLRLNKMKNELYGPKTRK